MKVLLLLLLTVLSLCGCGQKPFPSSRLIQTAGHFSFITPDNWLRTKPIGIDYFVVSSPDDSGMQPNIFVNGITATTNLNDAAIQLVGWYKSSLPAYTASNQAPFMTASGIPALKITAQKQTREAMQISMFHYLFLTGARVIQITCSCPTQVCGKYEPVFDSAMRSLEAEGMK